MACGEGWAAAAADDNNMDPRHAHDHAALSNKRTSATLPRPDSALQMAWACARLWAMPPPLALALADALAAHRVVDGSSWRSSRPAAGQAGSTEVSAATKQQHPAKSAGKAQRHRTCTGRCCYEEQQR